MSLFQTLNLNIEISNFHQMKESTFISTELDFSLTIQQQQNWFYEHTILKCKNLFKEQKEPQMLMIQQPTCLILDFDMNLDFLDMIQQQLFQLPLKQSIKFLMKLLIWDMLSFLSLLITSEKNLFLIHSVSNTFLMKDAIKFQYFANHQYFHHHLHTIVVHDLNVFLVRLY